MDRAERDKLSFFAPKPFVSPEDMEEIWNARGLKHRIDEIHVSLLSRGLTPNVDREAFRKVIRSALDHFLVEGRSKPDPRLAPKPRFPKVF